LHSGPAPPKAIMAFGATAFTNAPWLRSNEGKATLVSKHSYETDARVECNYRGEVALGQG